MAAQDQAISTDYIKANIFTRGVLLNAGCVGVIMRQ